MSSRLIVVLKQQKSFVFLIPLPYSVSSPPKHEEQRSWVVPGSFSPLVSLMESKDGWMITCGCDFFVCLFVCGSSRPSEQSELKLVCNAFERPELSSDINVRNWCIQENPGEICKTDAGIGSSLPAAQEEAGV